MNISARVRSREGGHQATVTTNGAEQAIAISPKASGFGSSVSGGELLFLALATCSCDDIYREAARQGIRVDQVVVDVTGQFGAEGEPATQVPYRARVVADASEADIRALMLRTDALAEVHNTLRVATPVALDQFVAVSAKG
ncbi:MAG TPA: OsmC family protein [Thermomicrobiales bacterium]|nr:OsmC family protein [Thermomicrobiales bacterium]